MERDPADFRMTWGETALGVVLAVVVISVACGVTLFGGWKLLAAIAADGPAE